MVSWLVVAKRTPVLSKARQTGVIPSGNRANTVPTPEVLNFSIMPFWPATKRLPPLSKAMPVGELTPELAKTVPTPDELNFLILLALALAT
jgi:hypothetical protein